VKMLTLFYVFLNSSTPHSSSGARRWQQSLENGSFRKSKLKDISWRVDHVIASSDEDAKEETGTQVQLILQIDGAPHLPDEPENQEAKNNILAVEMTGEKFDVLFHELSEARQIMRSLK